LSAELFNTLAGLRIVPIPYKGGGPAVIGLLSAQAHMMFAPAAVAMPHVNSGKLRGLAVTTAQPSTLFPQLPTMASAGVPGYESIAMFGEFVPAGTPMPIVNRLSHEIARCMQRPDVKEKFLNAGVESVGTTPEKFAAIVRSEMAKWGRLIKDAGIRVE
jgi:tripartite-type tricarboxylate transporter receptor subunit TctC